MRTTPAMLQILVIIVSGVIATLTLGALPIFIARIAQSFELSIAQSGLLASADLGGCAIGCVAALLIQKRLSWRPILIASIGLAVLGNMLSIISGNYGQILSSRLLAGIGNGFIVSLVFTALCASRNPDRNFGFYTLGQLIAQAVTLPLFTCLVDVYAIDSIFIFLAIISASLFILIPFFPTKRQAFSDITDVEKAIPESVVFSRSLPSLGAIKGLVGLCLYFWGFSAIWAFFDPIGQNAGVSIEDIGKALGIASIIGISGPILVVVMQPLLKRSILLTAGIGIHIVSLVILYFSDTYWSFLMGTSLFLFSLNFVFPFQMGTLSKFDKDGSIAVISLVVQLACLATGPILGGYIYQISNQTVLLLSAGIAFCLTIAFFALSSKSLPQESGESTPLH